MQTPSDHEFSMRIRPRPVGQETIVMVSGEVDLLTAEELERLVRQEMERGPVFLDLREVAFIDSSGLRALDGLARHGGSGGLRIHPELSPSVAQILELTGMLKILPLATADDAR